MLMPAWVTCASTSLQQSPVIAGLPYPSHPPKRRALCSNVAPQTVQPSPPSALGPRDRAVDRDGGAVRGSRRAGRGRGWCFGEGWTFVFFGAIKCMI